MKMLEEEIHNWSNLTHTHYKISLASDNCDIIHLKSNPKKFFNSFNLLLLSIWL
jgi:hypothetical protein